VKIPHFLIALLLIIGLMRPAAADQYPSRPVTVIVPYAAGGATDIVARLVAKGLLDELGQSFSVENKGGGGGMIGMTAAAGSPADGYTLLVASTGPATISPLLYPKLEYDPLLKLDPIIQIASAPGILLVRNGSPAETLGDLIKLSKQSPGRLNMASAGNGSLQQLIGEYLQLHEGIKWTHVPFRGSAPALNELMAERVDIMVDVVPSAAPFVTAGKMRAIAVMSQKRSSQLPDVPTFSELGYQGIDFSGWHGLFAPKETPKAVTDKLNAAVNKLLQNLDFQNKLRAIGAEPDGGTSDELRQRMVKEMKSWGAVIKRAGLVVN
jgi:tripartite-type tricarboxylate transporter receptor subunit TctC